jgi:hypothetical protein
MKTTSEMKKDKANTSTSVLAKKRQIEVISDEKDAFSSLLKNCEVERIKELVLQA